MHVKKRKHKCIGSICDFTSVYAVISRSKRKRKSIASYIEHYIELSAYF